MCPKCGGKMAFDPKKRALACEHCGHTMHEYQAIMSGALVTEVQEHDFFATLPTCSAPLANPKERALTCKGCGAVFAWRLPRFPARARTANRRTSFRRKTWVN